VAESDDRDQYSGLIRLHALHHASEEPIFGLGMLEELARHGYSISPGTLYPILHGFEKKGHLRSTERREGNSLAGSIAHASRPEGSGTAKNKIRELFLEVVGR
jgi:PadR family transcriptional regulator, regulatory protein PadR